MSFLAFGINHNTAPVDVREKVAFDLQKIGQALRSLIAQPEVSEAVILSTCNRTEIYCTGDKPLEVPSLLSWLAEFHQVDQSSIEPCSFYYRDQEAVSHVMRVASGLDSLVLGEPQILGQLKSAYASSLEEKAVGGRLGRMFEHSFSVAKKVRTETAIGENPVSVAAAAVDLARQLFADFSSNTALLIGAGKTTELVARHLKQAGVKRMIIANRTLARAQELADEVGGDSALLGDIPDLLIESDIVIASTASALPILGKGAVERALKYRKHRPIFMVDIAVPRDIEPQVAELSDVFLYTVDDLKQVIDQNLQSRQEAAREAEALVEQGSEYFMGQLRASGVSDLLRSFRSHAESIQQAEVEKSLNALRGGADPEAVVRSLARSITNKLIHTPTHQVRKSAEAGDESAATWLSALFNLSDDKLD